MSAVSNHPLPTGHCSCELETERGPAGPILVLRVAGEIDLLTVPAFENALDAVVDKRPGDLVVDLAAVVFCSARGFAVLLDAAATAQTNGTNWVLSGMHPHLDRIATLMWPEPHCLRYRSAAAAVSAIRIGHTYQPA